MTNNDVVTPNKHDILTATNYENTLPLPTGCRYNIKGEIEPALVPAIIARKLVASIGRRKIFAILCMVGHTTISLDVDTGAEVNVMPSEVFHKLRQMVKWINNLKA